VTTNQASVEGRALSSAATVSRSGWLTALSLAPLGNY
jgi:hypothetical protein